MTKDALSCGSLISENSNGLSNLSTLWSDGFPSIADSLDMLSDEEVESQNHARLYLRGSEIGVVVSPASSSAKPAFPDFEEDVELAVPVNRPVSDFRKYKTTLCRSWTASSLCTFGTACIFAHGGAELRSETNNETLKLAHQLLGGMQERPPRRRVRRRHRRRGHVSCDLSGDEGPDKDEDSTFGAKDAKQVNAAACAPAPHGILGDGDISYLTHTVPSNLGHPILGQSSFVPVAVPSAHGPSEPSARTHLPCACPANSIQELQMAPCTTTDMNCIQGLYARLQMLERESDVLRKYLDHHLKCVLPPERSSPPAPQSATSSVPVAPHFIPPPLPTPRPPERHRSRGQPLVKVSRGQPPLARPLDVVLHGGPYPAPPGLQDPMPCFTVSPNRAFPLPPSL
eukprot:GGOE01011626.1.p1 GENE.GGOE01011626.1~~GGOE01011626.1.p1  ORF type:complete len:435 (+),score=13.15 GGOE01011626.1:111-1307(+)